MQKNPGYNGFYTDEKCALAIQESIDFVASKMAIAGGGLMKRVAYIDTNATDAMYPLPSDCSLIDVVRYKSSDTYIPVEYADDSMTPQVASTSATQFPTKYRLIGQNIFFNPQATTVGTAYLQIEYMGYPVFLLDDDQKIDEEIDRAMCWYIKYRAASTLVVNNGGFPRWGTLEDQWEKQVDLIIHKRIRKPRYVKEFME